MASMAWSPYVPEKKAASDDFAAVLSPGWIEIGLALTALLVYGVTGAYDDMMVVGNVVGPTLLSLSAAWGGYTMMQRNIRSLWVPLLWYRVAMFTYYGLGSLVPLFVNPETREQIMDFYSFFPRDMVKLNSLIVLFHLIVIVGARLVFAALSRKRNSERVRERLVKLISPANFSLGLCGSVFLGVGAAANFLLILPVTLGWFAMTSIGPLYNLALASLIGYFMLTYWSLLHRKYWVLGVVIGFAIAETLLGLLQMTKFVAMFPAAMVGMGFIFHRPTIARLAGLAVTLMAVFFFLTPIISYARDVNYAYYQGIATPAEVVEIYNSYSGRDTSADPYANVQSGWARLSYVNAGTFAINQYDRHQPGDSYRYAFIVWVPRVIYPDKPNITDVSREFTYAVNGNYDSSSSAGLPAEAYWNFGWPGVLVASLFVMLTLSLWSIYSYTALQRGAWHLFFVVLMGMRLGTRMDGSLVADIIGPIGIGLISHIILEFLNRFLPERVAARWSNRAEPAAAE